MQPFNGNSVATCGNKPPVLLNLIGYKILIALNQTSLSRHCLFRWETDYQLMCECGEISRHQGLRAQIALHILKMCWELSLQRVQASPAHFSCHYFHTMECLFLESRTYSVSQHSLNNTKVSLEEEKQEALKDSVGWMDFIKQGAELWNERIKVRMSYHASLRNLSCNLFL